MSSQCLWKIEKEKLINLPIEEKRKLYKSHDYVTLDKVDTWVKYANSNPVLDRVIPSGDLKQFERNSINTDLNESLVDKVSIFKGDITKLEIDAIVNAANSRLKAGGGVDGAIHRAAGEMLQKENDSIGCCSTGDAKITSGYLLPAKYVIHTVGPQDGSPEKLESCYQKCLSYTEEYNIKSIAFPCISTGIYGFPNRLAGHIALNAAREYLEKHNHIDRIIFCTFLPVDVEIYETLMKLYFPLSE